ncbi:MAG: hypothetical protein AAFO07_29440 [Bacteroidota bacterium]
MLSIFATTDKFDQLKEIIQREHRLEELITFVDLLEQKPVPSANSIMVKQDEIFPLIDWHNIQPPFLLPESIELNESNFLGLLFAMLNNFEKAYEHLNPSNAPLFLELDFINRLQQGFPIQANELISEYTPFDEYRLMHNNAIIMHYGGRMDEADLEKTQYFYLEALQCAPNDEYRAFTARHYALLLIDIGEIKNAERLLKSAINFAMTEDARVELQQSLCQAWMQHLTVPYDQELLAQLKKMLWDVLQVYQKQGRSRDEALLLIDAGIIANYSESWTESLGYFNRALSIFEKEQLVELAANVHYHKGTLFSTWAQSGNPQFYRSAAESYQKAVKVFNKEDAPTVYADIQHQLGIVFSEIPDEIKKKSIWAAVSSSAFQEALSVYNKDLYPYQYASICNHYGNALTKYPEAVLSDNYDKALFYYQEALNIRTAKDYPFERCLTLLNFLEAQWNLGMPEDKLEEKRFDVMMEKAQEILLITQDKQLIQDALSHLDKLSKLKEAYA